MSFFRKSLVVVAGIMSCVTWSSALAGYSSVTIHVSGYSYAPFVTTSQSAVSDVELDAAGNLYACQSGDIRRVTPGGTVSMWSMAFALDLVFAPTGQGYGAGGPQCGFCIVVISSGGASTPLHTDSNTWRWLALGTNGTLYAAASRATASPPAGAALYTIDRVTGGPSLLIDGGPGPGGNGVYSGMLIGTDGKLYVSGNTDGSPASWGVFRLDGNQFTKVGPWPHTGFGLAQDNQGTFYAATTVERFDGSTGHEVWMLDPSTASATLLADGPRGASSVAYDRARGLLYVGGSSGTIYTIAGSPVPAAKTTWGSLKAKYR